MAVDSKHPLYSQMLPDFIQMRDTWRGERQVKFMGVKYLPPTSGMTKDGLDIIDEKGRQVYESYKKRAIFPEFVRDAVQANLGSMHSKPAVIELPEQMEPLRLIATNKGESLQELLMKVNEEQLISGRAGLLADVIDSGPRQDQMYISMYRAEDMINWDEGERSLTEPLTLNLVVLDETAPERSTDLDWDGSAQKNHRVLVLGNTDPNELEGKYRFGLFVDDDVQFREEKLLVPSRLGREMTKIPFTFVNSSDLNPDTREPPLLGLSNAALATYRAEADYNQFLYLQGQPTLALFGKMRDDDRNEGPVRTGAGAILRFSSNESRAGYVAVDSSGLEEQRKNLENRYLRAESKAANLLEITRQRESAEALQLRVAHKTATLNQIAITGAAGLQDALRNIAIWMNLDPDSVRVMPNLDFADRKIMREEMTVLMDAVEMELISLQTAHDIAVRRGMTEMEFEQERAQITQEKTAKAERARELGVDPTQQTQDSEEEGSEDESGQET